jgi:hypothetical protein
MKAITPPPPNKQSTWQRCNERTREKKTKKRRIKIIEVREFS